MTVAPHSGTGAVTGYDPDENIGLEDVGVGDVVMPRLQIVHDGAMFRDSQSKQEFPSLEVILLGLIKQRTMWHPEVDDGDKPMCKSTDFEHGFPNVSDETKKDKRFPWDKSNFDPANFAPDPNFNNLITLPCNSCIFKEWDKGDWKTPPCAEQHTYALLYNSTPDAASDEDKTWQPALVSFQKTGIKPSRTYLSAFASSRQPLFTVFTTLSLSQQSRGQVKYSVPVFRKGGPTDRNAWGEFADQYRQVRDYVRQPPRNEDDEYVESSVAAPSSNENVAPAAAPAQPASPAPAAQPAAAPAAAAPAAPAQAAAPAAPAPAGDDLPF